MEDPDRLSYAMNIFMFPYLSPVVDLEAAVIARQWDTSFKSNTLMSYADTSALMSK